MEANNSYTNSNGQQVNIGTMPDAHLLNAFNKYNQRAKQVRESIAAKGAPVSAVFGYLDEIDTITKKLYAEIKKRGLMSL
jgi:hypothetical protein